jgi:hypothetical protein
MAATNSGIAVAAISSMTNVPGRVADLHKSVSDEMGKFQKEGESIAAQMQKFTRVMSAALRDSAEATKRLAEEKAAQEKAEAERLATEKVEAEKQAKIQADMTEIENARKACMELVQRHRFAQALDMIEQSAKRLQTPEGKAKGRQTVKAYNLLVELKAAIIEGVKAEVKTNPDTGYRFGWMGAKDILGADESKIVTRDGQYTWESVPAAQMMRFIKYFIEKGDMSRYEQAQYLFAVAFYIHEALGSNEKAREQESKYLKDALHLSSSVSDIAKAVLPDVEVN